MCADLGCAPRRRESRVGQMPNDIRIASRVAVSGANHESVRFIFACLRRRASRHDDYRTLWGILPGA